MSDESTLNEAEASDLARRISLDDLRARAEPKQRDDGSRYILVTRAEQRRLEIASWAEWGERREAGQRGECSHEDWQATATLYRDRDTEDGPVTSWSVGLEMTCVACLIYMQWLGLPVGEMGAPRVTTPAAIEVRLAVRPFVASARQIGEVSS